MAEKACGQIQTLEVNFFTTDSEEAGTSAGLSLRGVRLHTHALVHALSVLGEQLIARLNY